MSEIEKMYENAGVLKECLSPCYINKTWRKSHDCPNCDKRTDYPQFTAEKIVELYCFILSQEKYVMRFEATIPLTPDVFAEGVAKATNRIWTDLSEEERKQIRKILE